MISSNSHYALKGLSMQLQTIFHHFVFITLFVFCGAHVSHAQFIFTADLAGTNETPAVNTPAKGVGIFLLNAAKNQLTYRITVAGLSGANNGSHFHKASAGSNGNVVRDITSSYTGETAVGSWNVTSAEATDLLNGKIYVNVHTSLHAAGEIRGQLDLVPDFISTFSGDQEVPPVATPGTGIGFYYLDRTLLALDFFVILDSINSEITGAHLHKAPRGQNGSIVFDFTNTILFPIGGDVWQNLTQRDVNDLNAGSFYANIHSKDFSSGEIRGQIQPIQTYQASLDGAQENPPVTTAGRGTGVFHFDEQIRELSFQIVVSGLSGAITNAHIHNAPLGSNGNVVVDIKPVLVGNVAYGTWANMPAQMMQELRAGKLYVNFHTAANSGGEIRGQILPVLGAPTSVNDAHHPMDISLEQNHPNPFRTNSSIAFRLPETNLVTLDVFNALGKKVTTLIDQEEMMDGKHVIEIQSDQLPAGNYFYRLNAGKKTITKMLTVLR